ncbi:hypothetical protein QJS10_CPA05g01733 [Acorus calamus]|uniref:G3BP-like protein n=1 Tax=Acorus calamus TaxID=4465 RepID=A0AAV9ERH3_ACOCL|nr:hypothetical protein QJS10_CPA05g01733 [Acorus calamus]
MALPSVSPPSPTPASPHSAEVVSIITDLGFLRSDFLFLVNGFNPSVVNSLQVGKLFVDQYYQILYNMPEYLYGFYKDSSIISRPEPDGTVVSVTSVQDVNNKVLSFDSKNMRAEIVNVDYQDSYKGGVFVLVNGNLIGKEKVTKKFVQSFFLAPQENGYFVLNDAFQYVGETPPMETSNHLSTTQPESPQVLDHQVVEPATPPREDELDNVPVIEEAQTPTLVQPVHPVQQAPVSVIQPTPSLVEEDVLEKTCAFNNGLVIEEAMELSSVQKDPVSIVQPTPSSVQEDIQKRSYASIVMNGNKSTSPTTVKAAPVNVPTKTVEAASVKSSVQQAVPATTPALQPETSAPSVTNTSERSNTPEAEGYSIYVRNLPLNILASQLEQEFKKFGAIKPGGIQVRSIKQELPYCFGFVKFESQSSMQAAIEAAPFMVGDRKVQVELKRTTTRGK